MTQLNTKDFDLIGRDPHPAALSSLMLVLDVDNSLLPSPLLDPEGTPYPGVIGPGIVVEMNSSGKLILGQGVDITNPATPPKLFMVVVDGDKDFDGRFMHRPTLLQGGAELLTKSFVAGAYVPGTPLTVGTGGTAGKFLPRTLVTQQIYGFVGQDGYNTATAMLHVVLPQGGGGL